MKVGEKSNIKCCECNTLMLVDDIDFSFTGNYDMYLICPCGILATAEYRYKRLNRVRYFKDDDIIKEVKHNTSNLNGSEFD